MNALRRLAVVLWAVFGFVGLGVLLGYLWLDHALDRTRWSKPTVQFVGSEQGARSECPPLPRSVDELSRVVRRNPETDLRTYVTETYRCTSDDGARSTFLTMLRAAARHGDGFAERSLEVIVRASCGTLRALVLPTESMAGAPEKDDRQKLEHAVADCIAFTMGQALAGDVDAEAQRRVLRIAEIHTLIEAEVASEELQQQFCSEVELVPAEALERLSGKHPALAATIAAICRIGIPIDAGTVE